MSLETQRAFNRWWGDLTRRGDPARRPHLTEEAFAAGWEAAQALRQEWKPIETVPLGQDVLAAWLYPRLDPDDYEGPECVRFNTPDSYWNNGSSNLISRRPGALWPTHWMTRPPSPGGAGR